MYLIKGDETTIFDKKMKPLFVFLFLFLFGLINFSNAQTISTASFQGSEKTIIFIISETPLKNQEARQQQTKMSSNVFENSLKNRERSNDSKVFSIPLKNQTEFQNKFSKVFVSLNPDFREKLSDKLNLQTINIHYKLYSLISQMNVIPSYDTKVLLESDQISNIDLVDLDETDVRLSKIEKYLIKNKHSLEHVKDFILELRLEGNDYSTSRNYLINILN